MPPLLYVEVVAEPPARLPVLPPVLKRTIGEVPLFPFVFTVYSIPAFLSSDHTLAAASGSGSWNNNVLLKIFMTFLLNVL